MSFHANPLKISLKLSVNLIPLGIVHPESTTSDLKAIQIPHGIDCRLLIGEFAETKSLWPACLAVVNDSELR